MARPLASATIVDSDGRHDVSVPEGTTVAGLMAMLKIDATSVSLNVTGPDGRAVDPGAVIGRDVDSGSVIALSNRRQSRIIAGRAAQNTDLPWFRSVYTGVLLLLALALVEASVLALPLFGFFEPPPWIRAVAAIVCMLGCAAPMAVSGVRRAPWMVVPLSALFGLTSLAFIPVDAEFAMLAASVAPVWWALIGSLLASTVSGSPLTQLLSAAWAMLAAASTVRAFFDIGLSTTAPMLLTLAVLVTSLTPTIAMRIPESQLLDLPLVATSAGSLRGPAPVPPSKITMHRVRRSMRDATVRAQTLLILGTALILFFAPPVATSMTWRTWEGRAAVVLIIVSFISLMTAGRDRREPSGRILPRVGAMIVAIAAASSAPSIDDVGPLGTALLLLGLAAVLVVGGLAGTRRDDSALVGRIVDVLQSLSNILILPAGVVAAGFFDVIRQVAS